MSEVPRLSNNEEGYGPMGRGYIAEVQIPDVVMNAFYELKEIYEDKLRSTAPR